MIQTSNHKENTEKRKRIAIIGSGISGQTCGYLLSQSHHVTLYESNNCLGGHTATVDVEIEKKQLAVDTGFIVFNDRTYPNFITLMNQIGINAQATEMSFSVHNDSNGLEYNGHNLNTLFAQRRNLLSPRFYRFVLEILRFNKLAKEFNERLLNDQALKGLNTLGDFLDAKNFDDYFSSNYILPMVAAIWSSPIESCREFPLSFFLRFFNNHGLLDIKNRPQWYVVEGGSRSYIQGLTRNIQDIRMNSPVESVRRHGSHIEVNSLNQSEIYDDVIFACHSDQALAILQDANTDESTVLGNIEYRNNEVVLHTDSSLLPKQKNAYASWNYWIDSNTSDLPCLTYNMNILQGLKTDATVCVTLNQSDKIDPKHVLRRFTYAHPVFTEGSIAAQQQRSTICGHNRTHFCGAYWYNGFHEDGVKSALDVCERFGVSLNSNVSHKCVLK
ncbi:MAG: putative NAD/FAD-binding protein [Flavobacteriales bacterium]|jgi:predicted NAD/FAD-binding protein